MVGFGDNNQLKKRKKYYSYNKSEYHQILHQAIKYQSEGNITRASKLYEFLIGKGFKDNALFGNYGIILINAGRLKDAELLIRKAIELNPKDATLYSNIGGIQKNLGRLKDAELSIRKAIELNPKDATLYSNLGTILKDLGKLEDAELSIRKAIELDPHLAIAYLALSDFHKSNSKNTKWQEKLFEENFLSNREPKEKIDIYFARANIHHKNRRFEKSANCLSLANQLKLNINPSNSEIIIKKSEVLLIESEKNEIKYKEQNNFSKYIFIVGMPRSGSTLLESIISMRNNVYDLGEVNIFEESFLKFKKSKKDKNLVDIYEEKIREKTDLDITTNKNLFNYQYAGIIAAHLPQAKIIYCFRNPLDNILSIYRAHFYQQISYASSLTDCANIYLNHEEIMSKYKKRFGSQIYNVNYDLLVTQPNTEIKSLINWLNWEWQESYLSPHLNIRSVSTASNVQVRSPINSNSIGGWKKYKKMLKPAMKIITQKNKYKDLKY